MKALKNENKKTDRKEKNKKSVYDLHYKNLFPEEEGFFQNLTHQLIKDDNYCLECNPFKNLSEDDLWGKSGKNLISLSTRFFCNSRNT